MNTLLFELHFVFPNTHAWSIKSFRKNNGYWVEHPWIILVPSMTVLDPPKCPSLSKKIESLFEKCFGNTISPVFSGMDIRGQMFTVPLHISLQYASEKLKSYQYIVIKCEARTGFHMWFKRLRKLNKHLRNFETSTFSFEFCALCVDIQIQKVGQ